MIDEADYIIVGAGSAGCLLANRLSADPAIKVFLLEAGGRDWNPLIRVPMVAGLLYFMKSLNWGYRTAPQPGLARRCLDWPRGRVLGGSSTINGMMYMRGNRHDYDNWQQMGLDGWGYGDLLPYFRAFENNLSQTDPRYHGHEGELWTETAKADHPLYHAWLESARIAGFAGNDDFNGARQEGVGIYDFNIHEGRRVSAASAFIGPVRSRANLVIETRAQVARLSFDGKTCTGVHLIDGGRTRMVRARREVILAAGAINSPQILQLSGIGPAPRLAALGIEPLVDSPEVGANLQDHLGIYVQNACTQPITLYGMMRPDRAILAGLQALLTGRGPATAVPLEVGGFVKTRPELDRPDVHITFVPGLSLATTRMGQMQHGFLTNVYQLRPQSRGKIELVSPDPCAKPLIDPNYLSHPQDLACLRDGLRLARRITGQKPFDAYRGAELSPGVETTADTEIDDWVRQTANTIFHPVGTCRMGADSGSVVSSHLRVRGVDRLRVVDASVMPAIVSGNTSAPTMMIAEKGARLILGDNR